MRFYTETHQHYCGIDLHARTMYVCILDREGQVLLHQNMPCDPDRFLRTIAPYRDDLVVAVECIFTWYWLADLCAQERIPFVLARISHIGNSFVYNELSISPVNRGFCGDDSKE